MNIKFSFKFILNISNSTELKISIKCQEKIWMKFYCEWVTFKIHDNCSWKKLLHIYVQNLIVHLRVQYIITVWIKCSEVWPRVPSKEYECIQVCIGSFILQLVNFMSFFVILILRWTTISLLLRNFVGFWGYNKTKIFINLSNPKMNSYKNL
jgi:hypothetical protein